MKAVRCAIYTRKSSDEGLEQGFNSLHAQREACAAYVLSQASEGWTLLPQEYDDGGISGGTLERPALQQLLADIAAGKIDIVVVYKVDRLTRSLLDFAKLVEAFDKAETSFVSITQSFNTTTSMGRLTLNMLLSFAQFEREVTAERIRDKLAASKAKGMWMGGVPPLGYRADGRSLAIVEEHAAVIREIYQRYRRLGNVRQLAEQFAAEGIHVPRRTAGTGRKFGGKPFTRGQLYAILKSPIYVGDIPHHDKVNPGNHPPLIAREAWEAVQQQIAGHVLGHRSGRAPTESLLAGKIFDDAGQPLLASHTTKGTQRYRYYVSKALHHAASDAGMRLPAREIEQVVGHALADLFDDPLRLAERAELDLQPATLKPMIAQACQQAQQLRRAGADIARLLDRVEIHEASLDLIVSSAAISELLGVARRDHGAASFTHPCPARVTRTGRTIRLVQPNGARAAGDDGVDPAVLRLIAKAQSWWQVLAEGHLDPTELAAREGVTVSWVIRVVRLAFLSPLVIEGILAGRLRVGIDGAALLKPETIAFDWETQEKRLLAG
jgi:DNA invertase Pin-like site-specific DNA recombinase